jgi:hypothetical protein
MTFYGITRFSQKRWQSATFGELIDMEQIRLPVKPVIIFLLLAAVLIPPAMAAGHWNLTTVERDWNDGYQDGVYTSIVVDKNDVPHVSWINEARSQVEYGVFRNDTWTIEQVGATQPRDSKYHSYSTSIALAADGTPAISYTGSSGELIFAHRTNEKWDNQVVASNAEYHDQWTSLKYDKTGLAHIAYGEKFYPANGAPSYTQLKWAYQSGDGSWRTEIVDYPAGQDQGYDPSLGFDGNRAIIAYRNGWTSGYLIEHLKIAAMDKDGGWHIYSDVSYPSGYYPSLAVDSTGKAHLIHTVYHAPSRSPGFTSIEYDIIDNSGSWIKSSENVVSWFNQDSRTTGWKALALDTADVPHIAYYDHGTLKYSTKNTATGQWDTRTVDDGNDVGTYTSIALDSAGNPWISYTDRTNLSLKVAHWEP